MKRRSLGILLLLLVLMAVMTVSASAAGDTLTDEEMAAATPITPGEAVNISLNPNEKVVYAIQTTKGGQIIGYTTSDDLRVSFSGYDTDGNRLTVYYSASGDKTVATNIPGRYYIVCENERTDTTTGTLTVTLTDNATNEELTSGQPMDVVLSDEEDQWLMIETTKAGQDVQIDIGGFNYANQGSFSLAFDGMKYPMSSSGGYDQGYTTNNGTWYFHAPKAGKHYIALYDCRNDSGNALPITVTATVLDGDKNEPNDTRETATALELGTDANFSVGGWGDEDWFKFEVAPNADGKNLYTLQFLDLNPDYSDQLYYEVYSLSGEQVAKTTLVNINHSNIMECTEQGFYYVRVMSVKNTGIFYDGSPVTNIAYSDFKELTRSTLRIRVKQGGNDPHENNDTWLTAAPIQVGQLTQHVLSSTTDADWFWFTAPEADMSFALEMSHVTEVCIYQAEVLGEYGASDNLTYDRYAYFDNGYDSVKNLYCKLAEAGVYYLKLTTTSSYASSDLRSFTVNLTSPGSEENNDTYAKAVQLYDSVPQSFDIAGTNDEDWFRIVLTEDASVKLASTRTEYYGDWVSYYLYRKADFESTGLNAAAVASGSFREKSGSDTVSLQAGTWYLKVCVNSGSCNQYSTGCTVTYTTSTVAGSSLESAISLDPEKWSECLTGDRYYSLGPLNAGDTVHISRDGSGHDPYVTLYDSEGNYVTQSGYANWSAAISKADNYYLEVKGITYGSYDSYSDYHDLNDELHGSRIQYAVSSNADTATAINGPEEITLYVGDSQFVPLQLDGGVSDTYEIYCYNNSDSSVAVYSNEITAKAAGTTTLTFHVRPAFDWPYQDVSVDGDYLTKTIEVTVLESPTATDIAIANAPTSMTLGQKVYLTSTLTPEGSNDAVTWSSSDSKILYVFPGGKTVAVGEGTATVTATCGELSATAQITVKAGAATESQITSLLLDSYSLTMYLDEGTQKLTATVQPAGINATITWTSSNTAAATVDQTGTVTAVAPGISIITAAAGDHNVSCVVTVQAARVRVTGIYFDSETFQLPRGNETQLVYTITPDNATTRTLTWVSDDPSVATVSRTGIVHGLAVGKTTIRATTLDGGFVAELELEVTAKAQRGDINGDGYVDAADAMLCLQNAVGLIELTEEQLEAGDVNNDGVVDAGDAIKILRYNVGLIETLD